MNNLIEHVRNPVQELRKAGPLLKSGGVIFIETPNTDSWDFKFFKRYWGGSIPQDTHFYLTQDPPMPRELTKLKVENFCSQSIPTIGH